MGGRWGRFFGIENLQAQSGFNLKVVLEIHC